MNNKKAADRLKKVVEILSKPNTWCRGSDAINSDGVEVDPLDKNAVKFCAEGAFCKAFNISPNGVNFDSVKKNDVNKVWEKLEEEAVARGYNSVDDFNDNQIDKRRVISFFNKVIAKLDI